VNGVQRAIRVNNSNNANAGRCSSRYSGQKRTWVNSDVGFRFVNGVMKGGSYLDGNRCDFNRCSYRLYTGKTVKYEMRGFRFVNGEYRGSQSLARALLTRSAGFRWSGSHRYLGVDLGFRCVNGVYRGGGYRSYAIRIGGLRYGDYAYRQKAETLGFRLVYQGVDALG